MIRKMIFPVLLLMAGIVNAGINVQSDVKSGTALTVNAVVQKSGNRYATSVSTSIGNRTYYTERAFGLVRLSADQLYTGSYSGTATVDLTIEYDVEVNGVFVTKTITQVLKLESDNAKVIDAAYYKAEGAERIKATITAVSIPAGWPLVQLEASVSTTSFDYMNLNDISAVNLSHNSTLTTDGNLQINWTALGSAESYELEWTYVSNQGAISTQILAANDIEVDWNLFRNNSSRVVVSGLSYQIPLMYERGYIIYRLRAAGKGVSNGVVVGSQTEWTTPDGVYGLVSDFPNKYLYDGLENNINWQSSLSFAEEGKHKAVLAYHDGSMRNRQAVTRINTDDRAVLGETFYDYNGRPVIQVLPVPVKENTLTYYPNFNLIEGESILQKADYTFISEGQGCVVVNSPTFATTTGASQYYSPNNNFGSNGNTGDNILNRDLIPDAKKYPYTQTQYTTDNTGRIVSQSGVGDAHQIGTKHETHYFYGAPQQEELTRLFGNQVGYNVHYKKNTTVDPNGQVSVSYMNMGGKVVATALAGNTPTYVDSLVGNKTKVVETNLFGMNGSTNMLNQDGLSKTYSSKFSVPADNNYTFDYSAVMGYYDLTCLSANSSNPIHFDGAVDLKIQLVNGCGSVIFIEQRNTVAGTSGATQNLSMPNVKALLPQGEYQLVKTLSINDDKLEKYWQNYLASPNNCLTKETQFQQEERARLDLTGCDLTCAQCEVEVNKILNVPGAIYGIEERARLLALCDDLCDEGIGCRGSMEAMRGDFSPGGQYAELRKSKVNNASAPKAEFDENNQPIIASTNISLNKTDGIFDAGDPADNQVNASEFPLSIFNEVNALPINEQLRGIVSSASWRNPIKITDSEYTGENWGNQVIYSKNNSLDNATYTLTDYMDRNTQLPFEATVIYNTTTNKFNPEITLAFGNSEIHVVDAATNLYKVKVKYIKNVADFEKYWQPHWSSYLLPYHPEFGYLLDCFNNYASNDFDYALSSTETLQQAKNKGYIDANGKPAIVGATQSASLDVFIKNNLSNYSYLRRRNNDYKGGVSMAKMANTNVNCPKGNEATTCGVLTCGDSLINSDMEWNVYKALYLSEKQQLMRSKATKKAVDNQYYNGCIGQSDFYTLPEAAYFRQPQLENYTYTYKDCHYSWLSLFNGSWGCNDVTKTVNALTPPIIDPKQVCFAGRVDRFTDKTKRFYISAPSSSSAGQMPLNCYNIDDDGTGNPVKVAVPCDNDIVAAMNEGIVEAQRFKYESCGLCPLASDLENVLMNLRENDYMPNKVNVPLTCPSDTVQLGDVLYRLFLNKNGNNSNITWDATLSSDGKTLNGTFNTGSSITASVTLNIPSGVPVTFSNLSKMCCMSVTGPNSFTFKSSYYNSVSRKDSAFHITGSSNFRIDTCYVPPRCMVTDDARRVTLLLNMLAATGGGKSNDLKTNNQVVELSDTPLKRDYYAAAVRTILKRENDLVFNQYLDDVTTVDPKWEGTQSGTTLHGVFYHTDGNGQLSFSIDLSGLNSAYSYGNIKEFSRMRPVSGSPTKFYVDALVTVSEGVDVLVTLTVETTSLQPTVCKFPVPALGE